MASLISFLSFSPRIYFRCKDASRNLENKNLSIDKVIHPLSVSDCIQDLFSQIVINWIPMVLNLPFNKSLNVRLIRFDVVQICSISQIVVPLPNPGHKMWSSGHVYPNIGLAKTFDEFVYLPKLALAALVQCIKQHSNFNLLRALFEEVHDGLLRWPVLVDVDRVIKNFEIRAVFLWRPCDLLQKTGRNFVRRLCLR